MDTERVLIDQTVVVEGGQIKAIGPVNQVQIPAGALRIDGRGKYLIPGLGDMHVHRPSEALGQAEEFRFLTMGVTSFRDLADGGIGVPVEEMRRLRQSFRTAQVPTLRPFLSRGARPPSEYPSAPPPESLATYVAAAKVAGYDHMVLPYGAEVITAADRVFFDSLVAASRREGLALLAHTHVLPRDGILALGGARGAIDHVTTLVHALGVHMPYEAGLANDTSAYASVPMAKVREFGVAMQRAGVWFVPTLACQTTVKSHTPIKEIPRIVKTLHDAGVKLLLAGDEADVQQDLAAMVQAGLSPYEALVTGTRHVAEYFDALDSLGTVAVGKRADLVLLYGNPLTNIGYMWDIAGVMSEGRWLDRAALDQGLLAAQRSKHLGALLHGMLNKFRGSETIYPLTKDQRQKFSGYFKVLGSLNKSLSAAAPSEYQGLAQKIASELGAVRAIMTSEQQMVFDASVRVWVRMEARQGHRIEVPGVPVVGMES